MVTGQLLPLLGSLNDVESFPTEMEMAEKVLKLPKANKGKYLINEKEFGPCLEQDYVVKLSIERGKNGFRVKESDGEEAGGGAHIRQESTLLGRKTLILRDKDETPLALAVQEGMKINKAYYIYSKTPMFEGESPVKEENGVAFYNMYKVRDIDDRNLDYRVLQIWNGNNYEPYFRVYPAPRSSGFGKKVGTHLIPPRKDDNLVVDPRKPGYCHAVMSKKRNGKGWDMVIAPGADTGAMLMLSAILDDMVGWFA